MPNQWTPRISKRTCRDIIAARNSGMSIHAIASKYHCSTSMVYKITNGDTRNDAERDASADMSAEELDELIAKRMKRLPKWWRDECPENRGEVRLPLAVSRGRGMQARHRRAEAM